MLSRNLLFDNPVAQASAAAATLLRGERLAEVVAERTNEFGAIRLVASKSLDVDTRREANGVAEDDNLTVTDEGELVINGHSAVVEKDWGKDMKPVRNFSKSFFTKGMWLTSYTVKQQRTEENGSEIQRGYYIILIGEDL